MNDRTNEHSRISSQDFVPRYIKVANHLVTGINDGRYASGGRLPSEADLISQYGISRTTAANALQELVTRKLAYRIQGKGTFVAKPPIGDFSFYSSYSEDIRRLNMRPGAVVLSFELKAPTEEMATKLQMPDEPYYRLFRLRLADNKPTALQETYLPCRLYPGLERIDFGDRSLFAVISQSYGFVPTWAEAIVEAVSLGRDEAELLKVRPRSPALLFWHLTSNENHVRLEYVKSHYRADVFRFSTGRARVRTTDYADQQM